MAADAPELLTPMPLEWLHARDLPVFRGPARKAFELARNTGTFLAEDSVELNASRVVVSLMPDDPGLAVDIFKLIDLISGYQNETASAMARSGRFTDEQTRLALDAKAGTDMLVGWFYSYATTFVFLNRFPVTMMKSGDRTIQCGFWRSPEIASTAIVEKSIRDLPYTGNFGGATGVQMAVDLIFGFESMFREGGEGLTYDAYLW